MYTAFTEERPKRLNEAQRSWYQPTKPVQRAFLGKVLISHWTTNTSNTVFYFIIAQILHREKNTPNITQNDEQITKNKPSR